MNTEVKPEACVVYMGALWVRALGSTHPARPRISFIFVSFVQGSRFLAGSRYPLVSRALRRILVPASRLLEVQPRGDL